jgi:hypothetical protein
MTSGFPTFLWDMHTMSDQRPEIENNGQQLTLMKYV